MSSHRPDRDSLKKNASETEADVSQRVLEESWLIKYQSLWLSIWEQLVSSVLLEEHITNTTLHHCHHHWGKYQKEENRQKLLQEEFDKDWLWASQILTVNTLAEAPVMKSQPMLTSLE